MKSQVFHFRMSDGDKENFTSTLVEGRSYTTIKEIILGAAAILISGVTFWLWRTSAIPALAGGDVQSGLRFIAPAAGLAVSAALFALAAMFIRDRRIIYGAAMIGAGTPYLLTDASNAALLLFAASLAGTAFAVHKIRREFALSVGFSVSKTVKSGLALYFTVSCLAISLFYSTTLNQKNSLAALLPKPAFDFTLYHFLNSSFAQSITGLPDVRQNMTADELLDMLARRQLQRQGVPEAQISSADLARLRKVEHTELGRQYGIAFQGNEKVQDIFYTVVAERADELMGPYRAYLPLVSSLAFFFALKALTLPVYLVSLVVIFLLIKALLFAKILKRAKEQIDVERITL